MWIQSFGQALYMQCRIAINLLYYLKELYCEKFKSRELCLTGLPSKARGNSIGSYNHNKVCLIVTVYGSGKVLIKNLQCQALISYFNTFYHHKIHFASRTRGIVWHVEFYSVSIWIPRKLGMLDLSTYSLVVLGSSNT